MNWPNVYLKYQRYESFCSCLGARKIICWSEFPDIPKSLWSKSENKGKEETNKKKKKRKAILNFKNFYSVSRVSGVNINKNVWIMHHLAGIQLLACSKTDQTHKTDETS